MALNQQQFEKMVSAPSTGAITYQARALIQALERINEKEYLPQACQIRDIFLCTIDYVLEELWNLQKAADLAPSIPSRELARARALGRVLHEIYSYVRYLWASSPRQSPPGIQVALEQLTRMYFPEENGTPLSVVRPQWKYNLTYVPMSWYLRRLLKLSEPRSNRKTWGDGL